jgi:hypothetical protein
MDRFVADQPFIPDLDAQVIEENQRIDRFQGAPCQVATSSSTASVTALIRSGETSIP